MIARSWEAFRAGKEFHLYSAAPPAGSRGRATSLAPKAVPREIAQ